MPDAMIQLQSGAFVNLAAPNVEDVEIEDIAYALAGIYRFTGHTRYTVAQHCVMASWLVPQEFKLEALLHDATEAYLGDVSSPLKALLPSYKKLERVWWTAIAMRYGLNTDGISKIVHAADRRLLELEREVFFKAYSGRSDIPLVRTMEKRVRTLLANPWSPAEAEMQFSKIVLPLVS